MIQSLLGNQCEYFWSERSAYRALGHCRQNVVTTIYVFFSLSFFFFLSWLFLWPKFSLSGIFFNTFKHSFNKFKLSQIYSDIRSSQYKKFKYIQIVQYIEFPFNIFKYILSFIRSNIGKLKIFKHSFAQYDSSQIQFVSLELL